MNIDRTISRRSAYRPGRSERYRITEARQASGRINVNVPATSSAVFRSREKSRDESFQTFHAAGEPISSKPRMMSGKPANPAQSRSNPNRARRIEPHRKMARPTGSTVGRLNRLVDVVDRYLPG